MRSREWLSALARISCAALARAVAAAGSVELGSVQPARRTSRLSYASRTATKQRHSGGRAM